MKFLIVFDRSFAKIGKLGKLKRHLADESAIRGRGCRGISWKSWCWPRHGLITRGKWAEPPRNAKSCDSFFVEKSLLDPRFHNKWFLVSFIPYLCTLPIPCASTCIYITVALTRYIFLAPFFRAEERKMNKGERKENEFAWGYCSSRRVEKTARIHLAERRFFLASEFASILDWTRESCQLRTKVRRGSFRILCSKY